jgi:purine-binding chemotaxis protein CheW
MPAVRHACFSSFQSVPMNINTTQQAALPDAQAAAGMQSLLRMSVGGEVVAVPISQVREILQVGRMTTMPRTPAFVCGVMNLRGAVVPVIDLAARLGGAATVVGRRSCIVVVDGNDLRSALQAGHSDDDDDDEDGHGHGKPMVVGLLVDGVYEVFDITAAEVEPVPVLGTQVEGRFLDGMARARGQVLGVLALARVLAPAELGALISAHQPH